MMIRKQIYLGQRQQVAVKRLARAEGVSEAEIIRQAIDRQEGQSAFDPPPPDPAAREALFQFLSELRARGPVSGRMRKWKREDAYEERLSRYARRSR